MKKHTLPLAILVALSGATSIQAQEIEIGKTTIGFHGYIKVDAMFTEYNDGIPKSAAIDDFYIPALVPTRAADSVNTSEGIQFNSHAKQSRFNLGSSTVLANGEKITGFIEMDFGPGNAPSNGEATTNRSGVDLRHAFISYGKWKFGQTWTNALNGSAIAETLDFFALSEGMIDTRQMQVRYTNGPLSISLENPETTIGRAQTNDSSIPDLIARYSFKGDWGNVSVAGLVRQLNTDPTQTASGESESESALGFSVAGRVKTFGKDDVRFQLHGGNTGRYVGVAAQKDLVGEEVEEAISYMVAYRHYWTKDTRSSVFYGNITTDLSDADRSHWGVNIFKNYTPKLSFGAELGQFIQDDSNTDSIYLQFSAKYGF